MRMFNLIINMKSDKTVHGVAIVQTDLWQMPQTSLANATDIVGKCHGYRWHMPCIIAADVSFL